jgi:hypothetical protein
MYPKKIWSFRVITFKSYLVFYKFNKKNELFIFIDYFLVHKII